MFDLPVKPVLCALKELKVIPSTSISSRGDIVSSAHSLRRSVNGMFPTSFMHLQVEKW